MTKQVSLFLLTVALLLMPFTAEAQSRLNGLTNICISEAGFQTRTADCALIVEVLRNRSSTGTVTMGIMRNYSTKVFNRSRTDHRRWIPWMTPTRVRPRGFPSNLTWNPTYRQRYWGVRRHVHRILTGQVMTRYSPDHWGARSLRRQRLRDGWQLIVRGRPHDPNRPHLPHETYNDFWMLPGNFYIDDE